MNCLNHAYRVPVNLRLSRMFKGGIGLAVILLCLNHLPLRAQDSGSGAATDVIPAPVLEHFCDLEVELNPTWEMGTGLAGKRRIIPIVGGTVTGKDFKGKILDVGADWQTVLPDGTAELIARYAFETEEGAIIEINNYGYRHGPPDVLAAMARGEEVPPTAYYMRTQARLETGHPKYQWVNNRVFVGTGGKVKDKVFISLYVVN